MVKLRDRLRSPFRGGATSGGSSSSPTASQTTIGNRRRSQRIQSLREQQQQQQRERMEASTETTRRRDNPIQITSQRRPFEAIESSNSSGSLSVFRRMLSSPTKKRRSGEGSGDAVATAGGVGSFVRVSGMFRASSSASEDIEAVTSSSSNEFDYSFETEESMDTSDDGNNMTKHPFSVLSPNCGKTSANSAASVKPHFITAAYNAMDVVDGQDVLEWMKVDAPPDVLPKILSFCGARQMDALSKVNKAWNAIVKNDSVWRVLCEDTQKVCCLEVE
jgi:hypothetical protein